MCSTTDLQEQNARESTATLAPLASPSVKAAAPSTAAMGLHPQKTCASSDGATADVAPAPNAGEKRHRHAPEEVEDWLPGMGLGDDADLHLQSRRARLAATSLLFERLVRETAIVRAHVIERRRRDQIERDFSRQLAERHPLRPLAHALHARSVTCELASPPSDEEHAAACARQSAELLKSKVAEGWGVGRVAELQPSGCLSG